VGAGVEDGGGGLSGWRAGSCLRLPAPYTLLWTGRGFCAAGAVQGAGQQRGSLVAAPAVRRAAAAEEVQAGQPGPAQAAPPSCARPPRRPPGSSDCCRRWASCCSWCYRCSPAPPAPPAVCWS
jgi:hypothetical protein